MSSTAPTANTHAAATPLVLAGHAAMAWLMGTTVIAMLLYYFIGIDQGMTSVFGNNVMVHEFVHDARHFLGFPCH